ncbi:MAG: ribonuclease Z [Christensenellaceae bacterium]|jgi:ribonuclease BN (tRNA processing enzyme)|nr:ribonuclease Z [Christensenellaceae bacterium]
MDIRFIGTGCFHTKRNNTSFIIGDKILFDCGFGIITKLHDVGIEPWDIETLIVSHFHPDHTGDLINFLFRREAYTKELFKSLKRLKRPLKIIGSVGLRAFIESYAELFKYNYPSIFDGVEIIEMRGGEARDFGEFKVSAFAVEHDSYDIADEALGFIFEQSGEKLGYSGDTALCENLTSNIKNADNWVIDTSHKKKKEGQVSHLDLVEVKEIAGEYPEKKFYAVHRRFEVEGNDGNLFFPNDGDIVSV